MGVWLAVVAALALVAVLAPPADAAISRAALEQAQQQNFSVSQELGEDVSLTSGHHGEKLFEVQLDSGGALVTHGPDARGDFEEAEPGLRPGDAERDPVCADRNAQHVLLGIPRGSANRLSEHAPAIRAAIRRMNYLLNQEALESGGPETDYRVLCEDSGEIKVDTFVGPAAGEDSFDNIVDAAKSAGFDDSSMKYSIFYDVSSAQHCGVGSIHPDDGPGADNRNNRGGSYASTWRNCWEGRAPMHENGHNMGAVQPGAPNSTGSGLHCNEREDVMCYSPDDGDRNQHGEVTNCPDKEHFDCGHDDYFDAAPEPGEWLSDHWNLGARVNRFLTFADDPAPAAPPHDDLADAEVLSGADAVRSSDSTEGATRERGEPNHANVPGGASVWYRWTAPSDGLVAVDTAGSEIDTVLAAYTGDSVDGLTEKVSNDDTDDTSSRLGFHASAGETYRIAIDGYNGVEGAISLRLRQAKPPVALTFAVEGSRDRKAGDTLVMRGTIRPPKSRVSILIDRKVDGSYRPYKTVAVRASTGTFRLSKRFNTKASYRFRARFDGDATHARTTSRSAYVRVR